MHLTAPSKSSAPKEGARNPQVVMAWFKLYTPTVTAAAVGQLRLSLRLVTPAVDAPHQSEGSLAHALVRVSAPPPPPPPPPIAPSTIAEPFGHARSPTGGRSAAQTSSRGAEPGPSSKHSKQDVSKLEISRFQIVTHKRTYILAAKTSRSARLWLEHLRAVLAVLRHGR